MAQDEQSPVPKAQPGASTPSTSERPYIPTLVVTSPANYGNLDAENESNLEILSGVDAPRATRAPQLQDSPDQDRARNPRKRAYSPGVGTMSGKSCSLFFQAIHVVRCMEWRLNNLADSKAATQTASRDNRPAEDACPLFQLPPELIDAVLEYLEPFELATVSGTCHFLRRHAISDVLWQRIVQSNVPGTKVTTTGPLRSYREVYAMHHQLWFLPKHKIWFCDLERTGRLIIVRYNPDAASIEAHQLVVACKRKMYQEWSADSRVIIHNFEATVGLHHARPILYFASGHGHHGRSFRRAANANHFFDEIPIPLDDRREGIFNSLSLSRPMQQADVEQSLSEEFPYDHIWPPPTIPAQEYIQGYSIDLPSESRPKRRDEASDQTFRIRRWIEMLGAIGVHMGEDISSYSTLDPKLYTPTKTRPYRGIWAGDYSGHGFEFLLVHQPDEAPATDAELELVRGDTESDEDWDKRRLEARVFRGRLEGIKLTGDPNVPRGEYTFVSDDLGPNGFVGRVHDAQLMGDDTRGTRVVRSKGHVALTGFVEGLFAHSFSRVLLTNVSSHRQVHREPAYAHQPRSTGAVLGRIRTHQLLSESRYRPILIVLMDLTAFAGRAPPRRVAQAAWLTH